MPRSPSFSFQAVHADTRQINPTMPNGISPSLAAMPGRQLEQFGGALSNLGAEGMREVTDMQLRANQVQVVSAQNKARAAMQELTYGGPSEPGFLSLKGESAVNPINDRPMSEEYGERLRNRLAKIHDSLGNDVQKLAFSAWRDQVEVDFSEQVARHQKREFDAHRISTFEGALKLGVDDATRDWRNPEKVRTAIEGAPVPGDSQKRYGGVRFAAHEMALAQGKSATEAEFDAKRAVSAAHTGVIVAALTNREPAYAAKHLDAYKRDMLEGDVLKVQDDVQRHLDARLAQTAVAVTVKEMANQFQPTRMDQLVSVVASIESNGRDLGADGLPTTSPKGAKYAMQVMPTTAKAPGFGIRPAADDSAAEYNRVGREYLGALVRKYGNVAQAMAAYNAGPAAVDEAIRTAQRDKAPEAWVSFLPAETRDYVRRGLDRYDGGAAIKPPTELEFVNAALAKLGDRASPEAVKTTRAAAEAQFHLIERATKDREASAVAEGLKWLEANGGNYAAMPADIKAAVAPKDYDTLRNFGRQVAKGDDTTNLAVYQKLAGDDRTLHGLSEAEFYSLRPALSESDFKHFAKERGEARSGRSSTSPEVVDTSTVNAVLNDRLRGMGRDPTPKDGSDDAAIVGETRRFVRQSILRAQASTGKKLTDAEIEKHIDGLFARSQDFRNTFMGFETGGVTRKQMLAMSISDVPSEVERRLRDDFRRQGVDDPTDAQILGAFWMLKDKK